MSKARELANLGNAYSDGALSNRNLIINGAMQVAQRGTSFSGITGGGAKYTLDRYFADISTSTSVTFSVDQSSDAPQGLNNSAKITITTSGATGSNDYSYFRQMIEGYNFDHLNFGTANAQTFTLSFWVKSSLTGTFGGYLGAALNDRFQTFTFSISSANTWEYKTITITGDTSGTWNKTNGVGLQVAWSLSCGSTYLGATGSWGSSLLLGATGQTNITETSGATFQITGVQLEVGDTATPFEHRSYGDELARCQRYYWKEDMTTEGQRMFGGGVGTSTTEVNTSVFLPVAMRGTPTLSYSDLQIRQANAAVTISSISTGTLNENSNQIRLLITTAGSITPGYVSHLRSTASGPAYLDLDAEL